MKVLKNTQKNGFTLVEIIVTMSIFSLVIAAIGLFARDTVYYNNLFSGGLTSYDDARKILQPVTSEIRGASPSSLGSYSIESANSTSFVFYTDTNGDGLKERIRYFLDNGILKRGIIIPSTSPINYLPSSEVVTDVISNLKNNGVPVFTYYDSSYNGNSLPLTEPVSIEDIRLVKITLIIDSDPNRPPLPITVTTQVSIRNLKDNL
ncbi:MAG TPA: prepilin-type N-terminal cleavage/methylation domain-containing protein [Candidatus Paceibacterota bacterium]|nr:prepilin-type N-terminal cleavage/methylation domain-containing protein [Candidatus Paceibacterota bacterium]